jgi:hypothetical protein
MQKEACVSITVGEKKAAPPVTPPVPPVTPPVPPKEMLPDITQLIVYQREAGVRGARVVTWTPEKVMPGTGKLTAGEDFDIVIILRNPHDTTVGGTAYITIDGARITEGRYTITAKYPGTFTTQVKGAAIPTAKAYEICGGVEA